jgi:site-specific recombinase XerD
MGKNSIYYKDKEQRQLETLERLLSDLPPLCRELIVYKKHTSALSTLISYCYDMTTFFKFYLKHENAKVTSMQDITYRTIESIPVTVFVEYQSYLECSNDPNDWHQESKKGIHRKFAGLRNLYKYHYKMGNIKFNPVNMVMLPKLTKDKAITVLTDEEINKLFAALSNQKIFKRGRQRTYKKLTRQRDLAIFTLLLNTGIRVGECVGLDFKDVDLIECSVTVIRKGGAMDKVFFNKNTRDVLKNYVKNERKAVYENKVTKASVLEQPFFYSIQGKRMSTDSIEKMVRDYTGKLFPYKHITPHKLRSTYGTALYRATGDIRLVGEVLGHDNINTTITYYAAFDDEKKKTAAKAVDLTKKALKKMDDSNKEDISVSITVNNFSPSLNKMERSVRMARNKTTSKKSNIIQFRAFSKR